MESEYEKQFQADLEKAQALSLESLALEKFKQMKLAQNQTHNNTKDAHIRSDKFERPKRKGSFQELKHETAEIDSRSVSNASQIKSRPRPGSFNARSSSVCSQPILAPPPTRRNSNSAFSSPNITNDLISFTSPSTQSESRVVADDWLTDTPSDNAVAVRHDLLPLFQTANNLPTYGFKSFDHTQNSIHIINNIAVANQSQNLVSLTPPPSNVPLPKILNIPSSSSSSYSSGQSTIKSSISAPSTSVAPRRLKNPLNVDVTLTAPKSSQSSNLIDLGVSSKPVNTTRFSILEIFDPLLNDNVDTDPPAVTTDDLESNCSSSMYNEYDPFDYMYETSSIADPIYAAVVKAPPLSPPPLPPRVQPSTLDRRKQSLQSTSFRSFDQNIVIEKRPRDYIDDEIVEFHRMVVQLRGKYKHTDRDSNPGLIVSPMFNRKYSPGTSIKLTVDLYNTAESVSFTCDVSCSVEHVIIHVLCELDQSPDEAHRLKVCGHAEFLAGNTNLSDYEYVHNCIKLEQDILLTLVPENQVDLSLSRTAHDDLVDSDIKIDSLLPNEGGNPISYDDLVILLETLQSEINKIEKSVVDNGGSSRVNVRGVIQAVKAICALMGSIETYDITQAVESFSSVCQKLLDSLNGPRMEIESEDGDYAVVRPKIGSISVESVKSACQRICCGVQGLIDMYCQAFRVNFQLSDRSKNHASAAPVEVSQVLDSVLVHVNALHRIPTTWKHVDYLIGVQVYHGTRPVGTPVLSSTTTITTTGFYPRIIFNSWLELEDVSICQLPRESRLVIVLYGRTVLPPEKDDVSPMPKYKEEELGWGAVQFFDCNGIFTQGNLLLSIWPSCADRRLGPAPCFGSHPTSDHAVLSIEIPSTTANKIYFPDEPPLTEESLIYETIEDFDSLDENTQQQLLDMIELDTFAKAPVECREVLWEKRRYMYKKPEALPKVLLAAHSWDWACLANLHRMLHNWRPMEPLQALQLLLPCFPDVEVRRCAVRWLDRLSNDDLIDVLPQLVQALKHETYEVSELAQLLLERALVSPRIAHYLYWLLTQNLPGSSPQNSQLTDGSSVDDLQIAFARYNRRLMLTLRALMAVSGESQRKRFMLQQLLVKNLHEVALIVQESKDSQRQHLLFDHLEPISANLLENPTCLPLTPTLIVNGIQTHTSSYFASNTWPLRIMFTSPDSTVIPAIFKVGDDLQQDMLTLQMVRVFDKLWLQEGLDLKMVIFACVATGPKRGMIEMVTQAETLRKIQVEWGLTGSFKDKPIAEWLAKHNPSELEYQRAVQNFTASCAGYSVITYLLGICDRHNDNIMLKTSGHLFHIDFGKFLGDAQMFGNFKRDRTPFVLTSDMAYVINGGDRPSVRFQDFVDLCCQAFNIIRKHGNLILHLFALMSSSGIPGVTIEAVNYVRRALMPGQSNPEAAAMFARLIENSLKSWFTQFNFFLHNLAQLRFTGGENEGELLSFVPKTYSAATDGRLLNLQLLGFQKHYDPNKHYVYIVKVERMNQPDPSYVLRTYREFQEFYQKICLHFPLAKVHSLPTGIHVGRSNIKQVAEKRRVDINHFLRTLFQTADEIAHSDLVYTFFHPLLRDQQPIDLFTLKLKDRRTVPRSDVGMIKGELKLSFVYLRDTFSVMVHHARSLPLMASGQEPNTYVKVYLNPDPPKVTKRKTKVVRRNCNPSFMEMLEYRLPLALINNRLLQATIWNHDPLQENEFLGGIEIDLSEFKLDQHEITNWYGLRNVTR